MFYTMPKNISIIQRQGKKAVSWGNPQHFAGCWLTFPLKAGQGAAGGGLELTAKLVINFRVIAL